ncbi:MlaD family protein [Aureisphaera galaxeae]|uniref:MlaD family protein n=1 Tax=Aureisphaera galaxeae TaxID=1538023 RepID=UPI0023501362|nr:MlaD family protein [Aureisphaera galaxeae]MDC8004177.1 MlaD family protein [Aureisphaera galaxeae]
MKLSREVKTAILVLSGILLFIFGYSFLKNSDLLNTSKVFYVKYDNVAGLATSAPVTINGLAVGKVMEIDFADRSGKLVVKFSVEKDFQFSKKSMVQIYSSGFIGGNNLGIIPDMSTNVMAVSGDTLKGEIQSGMIDGIIEKFDPLEKSLMQTLGRLDTVLNGVNEVLDEDTKANLRSSIANLNQTMASFKGASQNFNSLLNTNKEKMTNTLSNLDTTAANFAKLSDSLAQINVSSLASNLENTIGQLNELSEGIKNGEGSLGKLLKDEELYNNLTGASLQLEQLLEDMKLNPKRYVHFSLFGKRPKAYETPKDSVN